MSVPARLHPDDLERLAVLIRDGIARPAPVLVEGGMDDGDLAAVLEGLRAGTTAVVSALRGAERRPRLVDANELAQQLGVTPGWVREHAEGLGAVRLGDGPRPRLRFDEAQATEAFRRHARDGSRGSVEPDRPVVERRGGRRRRGAVAASAQRVAVPAWED